MFYQTFELLDIPKLFTLVFLECVLSADNAFIMAMIVQPLPYNQRSKALWTGIVSAIFLRIGAIVGIAYLVHILWIRFLGAFYLLYLAFSYGGKQIKPSHKSKSPRLWQVILKLEALDVMFALDSIIAALGFMGISLSKNSPIPPKLWIVYVGAIIGLVLMRFATQGFSVFMHKFPKLEQAAHYIIGLVGLKLAFEALNSYWHLLSARTIHYGESIFWICLISLFAYGFLSKKKSIQP